LCFVLAAEFGDDRSAVGRAGIGELTEGRQEIVPGHCRHKLLAKAGFEADQLVFADNGVFDPGIDTIFYTGVGPGNGQPPAGAPIKLFASGEYLAALPNFFLAPFSDMSYIMQDNPLNPGPEQIDVWMALWDVTGLNGSYLVRAVATDNLGNTDADTVGSGIPVAQIDVDSDIPSATVTEITLQNGTTITDLDTNPGQYISAAAAAQGRKAEVLETIKIKKYSPGVWHVVVDAKIA
jgi:hypothetical protein